MIRINTARAELFTVANWQLGRVMLSSLTLIPLESYTLELALGFMAFVSMGLFHHSKSSRFKFWILGWVAFNFGTVLSVLRTASTMSLLDIPSLFLLFLSAAFTDLGTRGTLSPASSLTYVAAITLSIAVWGLAGHLFSIQYELVLAPVGIIFGYTALSAAGSLMRSEDWGQVAAKICAIGLILYGTPAAFVSVLALIPVHVVFSILQVLGLVMAGAGLIALVMIRSKKTIEWERDMFHLFAGIVEHDLRNYVQVAIGALEILRESGTENEEVVQMALDTLDSAQEFMRQMRETSIALSQLERSLEVMDLSSIVMEAVKRIRQEYKSTNSDLIVNVPVPIRVLTNLLATELVWNILDNAANENGYPIIVDIGEVEKDSVTLRIVDVAGGMPADLMEYINSSEFSSKMNTKTGLGTILIKGLPSLCGAEISTTDNIWDERAVGTVYLITFERHH
jgi:signal transduction histidine kinase